jgi:hypothetical protein
MRLFTGKSFLGACVLASVLALTAAPAAAQSCSGTGCNGVNPAFSGCNGDLKILASTDLVDDAGIYVGWMNLVYSTTCQTVWTEVNSYWDSASLTAEINTNGLAYGTYGTGLGIATAMIYDPTPSGASALGSANVYTTTIFDCPPYNGGEFGQCTPSNHYASGNIVAP